MFNMIFNFKNSQGVWMHQVAKVLAFTSQMATDAVMDGLRRTLERGRYEIPSKVQAEKEAYEKENNPVLAFIEDTGTENIYNEPTRDVYRRYSIFCAQNGYQPLSNGAFSKRVNQALDIKTKDKKINGKAVKIFEEGR